MIDTKVFLSDIVVYSKYAKYIQALMRRENWAELVYRNAEMHAKRYPEIADEIHSVYARSVLSKKVVPSMRSFQFAGKAIEVNHSRMFNCSSRKLDSAVAFAEVMFLLLGGSGVGISVQRHHVAEIPALSTPKGRNKKFVVSDDIMGWADAIKVLMKSYMGGKTKFNFDFSEIRSKGTRLVTAGGKAPGPEPLKKCINHIKKILDRAIEDRGDGTKMKPIEAHDIACHIANAVLAGGIRRSAMISLFSHDDDEMLLSKGYFPVEVLEVTPMSQGERVEATSFDVQVRYKGRIESVILDKYSLEQTRESGTIAWYHLEEQRGRANNSVMIHRDTTTEEYFKSMMKKVEASKAGEPGVYWTNDYEIGTNPCCLGGDSKLLTANGYSPISNLEGVSDLKLINKNGDSVDGSVWETGEKELFEIKAGNTKSPYIINATSDHVFMTNDNQSVEVCALKGLRLKTHYTKNPVDINSLELRYGFVFGDGSFRKMSNSFLNIQCSFTPIKDDEVSVLFNRTGWSDDNTSYTVDVSYRELEAYGIDTSLATYDRVLPKSVSLDFLMGLFSANGCVINNGRVAFKTTSPRLRDGLIDALKEHGMYNAYYTTNKAKKISWDNGEYVSKESYDINLANLEDIKTFATKINFIQSYKRDALDKIIKDKSPFVYSIKNIGTQKVYDFNLQDDTHWGVVDGVVVHNCEISLDLNGGFCNLTEVNVSDIESYEDLVQRVKDATFLGTLQAGYTDFHYLGHQWKEIAERDSLLGVSMTGIGSGKILEFDIKGAAKEAISENIRVAKLININPAKRIGTIKPSGTASLVLGCSSGIHAWHNDFYVRRMRINKDESIYEYLSDKLGSEFMEDDCFNPKLTSVLSVPIKAPEGSILRTETPIDLLERVKKFQIDWIRGSHIDGANTHNVSVTVSIKPDEWDLVTQWMWDNKHFYNGISVLDYDGGSYPQNPFTDCTEEEYNRLNGLLVEAIKDFDITSIKEEEDYTDLKGESACSGSGCEISSL